MSAPFHALVIEDERGPALTLADPPDVVVADMMLPDFTTAE